MTRAEFRWVLIASLILVVFASLPTIYAWALADADHVFTGFVYNTEDGNSYMAKMRLGARGEWLFHIFYTPEPHQPALAFPFHLLLGKIGAGPGRAGQLPDCQGSVGPRAPGNPPFQSRSLISDLSGPLPEDAACALSAGGTGPDSVVYSQAQSAYRGTDWLQRRSWQV